MGRLVRDGLHPDQQPQVPLGAWCDAVWSIYFELGLQFRASEQMDAFGEVWDEIHAAPPVVQDDEQPVTAGGHRRPTEAERLAWGTSRQAQAGAANLAAMMGGMPPAAGE